MNTQKKVSTRNFNPGKEDKRLLIENLEKKLGKIRTAILHSHPFFGVIVAHFQFVIREDITSFAATDCYRNVYFHPACALLPEEDLVFVVLHEIMHAALLHMQRRGDRDPEIWYLACEYAANSIVVDELKKKLPKTFEVCYSREFSGKSAEEIYMILKELKIGGPSSKPKDTTDRKTIAGNGKSNTICRNKVAEERESCTTKSTACNENEPCQQEESIPNSLHGDLIEPRNKDEVKQAEEEMKSVVVKAYIVHQQLASSQKARGDIPGGILSFVKKLIEPKVPFEKLLARYASQFVAGKSEYVMNPPNKKYAFFFDTTMPSIKGENTARVILAIDTSGSISDKELQVFAGAMKKLSTLTPELTVITCDCSIHQIIRTSEVEEFLNNLVKGKTGFKGRGGTSHIPVFNWIDNEYIRKEGNPDLVVCLTDGYTEYPTKKPRYPVIWVLTRDHQEPPWGTKLILEADI